jgi:hypothetical protein
MVFIRQCPFPDELLARQNGIIDVILEVYMVKQFERLSQEAKIVFSSNRKYN